MNPMKLMIQCSNIGRKKPGNLKTGTISSCELDLQMIYIMVNGYLPDNITF